MADEPTPEEQAEALRDLWAEIQARTSAATPADLDALAEVTSAWLVGADRLNRRLGEEGRNGVPALR